MSVVESSFGATAVVPAWDNKCFPGSFGVGSSCEHIAATQPLITASAGSLLSRVEWLNRRVASAVGTRALLLLRWSATAALLVLPSGVMCLTPTTASGVDIRARRSAIAGCDVVRGAALSRRSGHRPRVRGVVQNPNDHPHGGRTRTVLRPRTPWSKPVLKSPQRWHER